MHSRPLGQRCTRSWTRSRVNLNDVREETLTLSDARRIRRAFDDHLLSPRLVLERVHERLKSRLLEAPGLRSDVTDDQNRARCPRARTPLEKDLSGRRRSSVTPVIPRLTTDGGEDRPHWARRSSRRGSDLQTRTHDRAISHRVTGSHESSRMEYGHSSRETRAGRGAVEATRGDDDGVLRRFTDSLPRAGELDDAHTGDGFVLRVATCQLLAGGLPDPLTGDGQVPGFRRFQTEAQRFRNQRSRTTCRRRRHQR